MFKTPSLLLSLCLAAVSASGADAPQPQTSTPQSQTPAAKALSASAKPAAKPVSPSAKAPDLKDSVLATVAAGKRYAIVRMDVNGSCHRFLSQGPGQGWVSSLPVRNKADDMAAVGSPDGQWIAFYSRRGGALNLWLAKQDGSGAEALSSDEVDIDGPLEDLRERLAFSPDSSRLAFVMHGDLWVCSLRDRSLSSVTHGRGVKALLWSPNGRWIAYVQGNSVKRVGPAGAPQEVLVNDLAAFPTLAWLGDSDKGGLLFFGRGLQRVTLERKLSLLWSSLLTPNRVAVLPGSTEKGLVLAPLSNGVGELFLVDFSGKTRKAEQVTQGGAQDALFLPDGKGFLFMREGQLWRCGLDGKQAKPLSDARLWAPWAGRLAPLECK